MTGIVRAGSRRRLWIAVMLALAAGALVWLWPRPRTNVLLITLDTTRADRLGCYGAARAKTPNLDALAAAGILCERASTVAPLTMPAHATLFTALYPAEHGLRTNGRGRLDPGLVTLADVLQRSGYDTGAFVASFVLDSKFGLDRGFATYDDDFSGDEPAHDALHRQRHGEKVVDATLAWLSGTRNKPFFCWVHLYDPHAPYLPHQELFGDEFADRPYDAEIAYVDRQIGRLVDFLRAQPEVDSQTLIVIVGDHGEGLGEHSELRHGSTLYESTLHVPLLFRLPDRSSAGRRVSANISMVDIAPTILDWLRLPELPDATGRSLGQTLLGGAPPHSPCFGATDDPFLENGWSPLRSLTDADWKYIRTTRVELYNLSQDPHERHNLAQADPERVQAMHERLVEFESGLVTRGATDVQLSAAERRALESLGYAGARRTAPSTATPENLPDVKDMLPFEVAVEEANRMIGGGALDEAIGRLRDVVRQAPGHPGATWALAQALSKQSRDDEATEVFRAHLAVRPDSRQGHLGLGLMLIRRDLAGAIAELRKAIELDPELAEAHFNLALGLLQAGRPQEALGHLNALIEIDPRHVGAYRWRAHARAGLRQIDAAVADYRTVVRYAPDSPEAHYNLGTFLARIGAVDEAGKHLLRATELDPRSAELQCALGAFLVVQRRFSEAIPHLTKALELKPDFPAAREGLEAAYQGQKDRGQSP